MNGQVIPFYRDPTPTRAYTIADGVIRPVTRRPKALEPADATRFRDYLAGRSIPPAPFAAEMHPEPAPGVHWSTKAIWFCAGVLFPFVMGILR